MEYHYQNAVKQMQVMFLAGEISEDDWVIHWDLLYFSEYRF